MPDFSRRSYDREMMDDLEFDGELLGRTLDEVSFINKWLGGDQVTLGGLEQIMQLTGKRKLSIADLGCGRGDILRLMAEWGRRNGIEMKLIGIDANAYTIRYAEKLSADYPEISYQQLDVLSPQMADLKVDIVNCTLFTHHFTDIQLYKLFSLLRTNTDTALLINDLHRHTLAYHSIRWLTAAFSKSEMVKNDAKLSVLRGFSRNELNMLLKESGWENIELKWKWAFRWQAIAYK